MAIEQSPKDVSSIYAAVNIVNYLRITPPPKELVEPLKAYFERQDQKYANLSREDKKTRGDLKKANDIEEKRLRTALKKAGSSNKFARDAWEVAYSGGMYLGRVVRYDGSNATLSVPRQNLTVHLGKSLDIGITSMEENYWMSLLGAKPQIVNPDFKEKALEWLIARIDERLSEKEFNFLDNVAIKSKEDTIVLRYDAKKPEI
jgi:hypothetical protein